MRKLIWLFKMAERDSRKNRARLVLFTASIIIGIAALVAINSFGENLTRDIDAQAKTLVGADLKLEMNKEPRDEAKALLDSIIHLASEWSSERSFASMVYFPKSEDSRLVNVRALQGDFPYYGVMTTAPANAYRDFRSGKEALLDQTVMIDYDVQLHDTVKVGYSKFTISGELMSVPGQSRLSMGTVPSVYIPMAHLEESGLVQQGSRVLYKWYFKFDDSQVAEDLAEAIGKDIRKKGFSYDTVESTKEDLNEGFAAMNNFLNLVAFMALLLGCIGVASAVYIYLKGKKETIAILRCLGVSARQSFGIYLIQIGAMGLIGSLVGAFFGVIVQTVLPTVLGTFIPFEVDMQIHWPSIFEGIVLGVVISLLFGLLPLVQVRHISPLNTLRVVQNERQGFDALRILVFGLIGGFIFIFAFRQMESASNALAFCIFLAISMGLLAGLGKIVMIATRRYFPVHWNFEWRQALANLYRPNNQTLILLISIGLGTALITTLFITRSLLLNQVNIAQEGEKPNMVIFDVQSPQKEALAQLTEENGLPVIQEVPIVSMRLEAINGVSRETLMADTSKGGPSRWAMNRESRVTYRDHLIDSETIIKGEWIPTYDPTKELIPVSLATNYADEGGLNVQVGDELEYNVQGAILKTYVASIREVDWGRIQTNFGLVFPKGVLEKAPQFHVLITKTQSQEQAITYQRAVVQAFPNVSVIDLGLILKTVDDLLAKVSFVITFMALFSILTGFMVLIGSVLLSKFQRIRESVLLRTLGAQKKQIFRITGLEYAFLGSLAAFTGILLSIPSSWLMAKYQLEVPFQVNWWPVLICLVLIPLIAVLIGLFNIRSIVDRSPLEVLRAEIN